MAGPQDFMAPVPSLRVDTAPMLAIANMLSQAPQNFAQSFGAGTNIALQRALANPKDYTDAQGNIDWGKLVQIGAQKGGLPFIEKLAPYIYMSGAASDPAVAEALKDYMPGRQPPQQTTAGIAHPAAAGPDNIKPMPRITGSGTKADPYVIPDQGSYNFFQRSDAFPQGAEWTSPGGASGTKGQPGGMTRGAPESAQPTAGPENTAEGQSVSSGASAPATSGVSGAPGPIATPGEVTDARQRLAQRLNQQFGGATSMPATAGREQPPAPPGPQPAETPPTTRQPLPPIDPAQDDPQIAQWRQEYDRAKYAATQLGLHNVNHMRDKAIDSFNAQAADLEKRIQNRQETLRKPFEETNKARAQGFQDARTAAQYTEADKKTVEESQKQLSALNGAAFAMGSDLIPHIANGKALLNSPGLQTGWGAETILDFNRAKAFFGDKNAAVQQEAFQKTSAAMQLGIVNMQRFLAGMGGQQSTRIFAHQINLVGQASASLGNTIAGNRFLLESADRMSKTMLHVQGMATEYLKSHPFLDQEFNQRVADYLAKNPLMTEREAKDPGRFLSAPQVPKGMTGDALLKWQHDMGLKEDDPVRRSDFDKLSPKDQNEKGYFKALKLTVPRRGEGVSPEQVPQQVPGR